ncbi:hypothetical protein D3C78_1106730 [compost metagenome]
MVIPHPKGLYSTKGRTHNHSVVPIRNRSIFTIHIRNNLINEIFSKLFSNQSIRRNHRICKRYILKCPVSLSVSYRSNNDLFHCMLQPKLIQNLIYLPFLAVSACACIKYILPVMHINHRIPLVRILIVCRQVNVDGTSFKLIQLDSAFRSERLNYVPLIIFPLNYGRLSLN